jgi:very-short-patch-repair endonuclease
MTTVRHGLKAGVVAADAAMHEGLIDRAGLSAATTRLQLGVRSRAKAARLLQLVDASSESPGESLTRMALVGLGVRFATQVDLRDSRGFIGRVDFLVEGRIVLEFDGLLKYQGQQGREALVAEKQREDRLRAAGYEVVRLTWTELHAPGRLALLLRQARSRAGLRSA